VTGDLTSAFDFRSPDDKRIQLPSTDAFFPPDTDRHPDYRPAVPAQQMMPRQEPGVRPARAVPYELQTTAAVDLAGRKVAIRFANTGRAAAVFQVRSGQSAAGDRYARGTASPSHPRASARVRAFSGTLSRKLVR
jgi:phospholipase C